MTNSSSKHYRLHIKTKKNDNDMLMKFFMDNITTPPTNNKSFTLNNECDYACKSTHAKYYLKIVTPRCL